MVYKIEDLHGKTLGIWPTLLDGVAIGYENDDKTNFNAEVAFPRAEIYKLVTALMDILEKDRLKEMGVE